MNWEYILNELSQWAVIFFFMWVHHHQADSISQLQKMKIEELEKFIKDNS